MPLRDANGDQGREFEDNIMQVLCIMGGSHKTKTTSYHPESDGMVEHFNRTLLMLAMFTGQNCDDCDDLLPAVMMHIVLVFMSLRASVRIGSYLVRNVLCVWMSSCHGGSRTCRIR